MPLRGPSTSVRNVIFIAGFIVQTTCGKKTCAGIWISSESESTSNAGSELQLSVNDSLVRLTRGGPVAATFPATSQHLFDEDHRILVSRHNTGTIFWFKAEV